MEKISKLIYDALAARRSVVLPEVGTLEVKRRGARKMDDNRIAPPRNEVIFTPDQLEGAVNVASLADVDYGEWLAGARREDGSVVIDGVGELTSGGFVTAPGLNAVLNPAGEEIVEIEKTRGGRWRVWCWILGVLLLAALALCALCCRGCFGCGEGGEGGKGWGWKRGKEAAVQTVAAGPAAAARADSLARVSAAASAQAAAAQTAAKAQGRFHVIAGAFSVESNADNYIAYLKRKYPELNPVKVPNPRTGQNMVSIFQMPTRKEASRKMNLYWDINTALWIFEEK